MAITSSLYSTSDAHVFSDSSNYNTTYVQAGKAPSSQAYGYFAFDANHGIPAGSVIKKATFYGWVYSAYASANYELTIRPSGAAWGETTITGTNKPTSTGVTATATIGAKDSSFAADITAIVQAWFTNPSFHYAWGFYITSDATNSGKNIRSRTTALSQYKPYITIEYEPATVRYGVDGEWKTCAMHYGVNGEWKQVVPYYGEGGGWK